MRHLMMYTMLTKPYGECFDVILIHAGSMFLMIRYRILEETMNATPIAGSRILVYLSVQVYQELE